MDRRDHEIPILRIDQLYRKISPHPQPAPRHEPGTLTDEEAWYQLVFEWAYYD